MGLNVGGIWVGLAEAENSVGNSGSGDVDLNKRIPLAPHQRMMFIRLSRPTSSYDTIKTLSNVEEKQKDVEPQ